MSTLRPITYIHTHSMRSKHYRTEWCDVIISEIWMKNSSKIHFCCFNLILFIVHRRTTTVCPLDSRFLLVFILIKPLFKQTSCFFRRSHNIQIKRIALWFRSFIFRLILVWWLHYCYATLIDLMQTHILFTYQLKCYFGSWISIGLVNFIRITYK